MDAIEAMLTRSSANTLDEPAPPALAIEIALRCAMCAPDHGRLRPARFLVVAGEALQALGELFGLALQLRIPETSEEHLQREREKALRAPVIVVAICRERAGRIPVQEQVCSVAASIQNLLLAFHSQGFGAMWKTGAVAYDQYVNAGLGLSEGERILGFVYAGTRREDACGRAAPEKQIPVEWLQDRDWHRNRIDT